MHEAIDSVFNFNESPEVSQVPHAAVNSCANLIAFVKCLPGILLYLFHSQTDTTRFRIDTQNLHFNLVAGIDNLTGMLDTLGPAHFGNMDQAFYSILQFDEGAIISNACNTTVDSGAYREAFFHTRPGIR